MDTGPDNSTTLIAAIMSMDVYNRDPVYGPAKIRLRLSASLGSWTLASGTTGYKKLTAFGATAWTSNGGETIIAYEGTVPTLTALGIIKSAAFGWATGLGFATSPQAYQALGFYRDYAGGPGANVILTGHSLGGGLAGYVGALEGVQGILFDNMAYQSAAWAAYGLSVGDYAGELGDTNVRTLISDPFLATAIYDGQGPWPPSFSGLSGYYVQGELLGFDNALIPHASESIVDLHNSSLMVMLLWASLYDSATPNGTAWYSAGQVFLDSLFGSESGKIANAVWSGASSSDLLSAIAYSAVASANPTAPASTYPFGSTAIQSLFADANTLGSLKTAGAFSGALASITPVALPAPGGLLSPGSYIPAPSPLNALMDIALQYAGDQAMAAGTSGIIGALALYSNDNDLHVDLDKTDWVSTYGTAGSHQILGVQELVSGVLYNVLGIDGRTMISAGVNPANAIDEFLAQQNPSEIDIAIGPNATLDPATAAVSFNASYANTILIGQANNGTIVAGDGNNLVFGGQDVTVGNGSNLIVGEAGGETITVGGGDNVVIGAGNGDTININGDQPNTDTSAGRSFGINFVYANNATINLNTGNGQMGITFLYVDNSPTNELLDLDQKTLAAAFNAAATNPNDRRCLL